MCRLAIFTALLACAGLVANVAGISMGALATTLGIGLLTVLCLVPTVILCEMLSRKTEAERSSQDRPALREMETYR